MCKCHCNVLSTCIQTVFLFSGAGLRVSQHLQGTSWRLSGVEFDLSLVWFGPPDPDPTSCFKVLILVLIFFMTIVALVWLESEPLPRDGSDPVFTSTY